MEQRTDIDKDARKYLLTQWQDSDNIIGMLEAFGRQLNDIEQAIYEVGTEFYLDVAIGKQLDVIGSIFTVGRDGMSDADYRTAIKAVSQTIYSGEPESIISIMKNQYGGTYVFYTPEYPAKYRVRSDSTITQSTLDKISPSGVQGFLAGRIVDALGNPIVDALGNNIIHVSA
jgi:hypothetical protein